MRVAGRSCVPAAAVLSILVATSWASDVQVNSCGQVVRGRAFLAADLDCTADPSQSSVIVERGRLELRGFTLQSATNAVRCESACQIVGPGTIGGTPGLAVWGRGPRSPVKITGVTIVTSAPISQGVSINGNLTLIDSSVSGYAHDGVQARQAKLVNSAISGAGGAGVGVYAGERATLIGSTVTAQGFDGVYAWRIRLRDSSVEGNGLHSICGVSQACADLNSGRQPILRGTSTCETSYSRFSGLPGQSWGVCTLD